MAVLAAAFTFMFSRPKEQAVAKFAMPEDVNPFTVLTLLREIRQRNGIADDKAVELASSIEEVERSWFGKEQSDEVDLKKLARTWLDRAN